MMRNNLSCLLLAFAVVPAAVRAQVTPPVRGAVAREAKSALADANPGTVWTQPFDLGPGESKGLGFVVGKPGPIVVNVLWTGVPLTISLTKPDGVRIAQQGTGRVTIQYSATADDVRKGMFWGVNIRPTQLALKPAGAATLIVVDKSVRQVVAGVATGSVNVQQPSGDLALAQAELKARAGQSRAAAVPSVAASMVASVVAQRQAVLQNPQIARQTALREALRPKIPAQAFQQLSQPVAPGTKSRAIEIPARSPATAASASPAVADPVIASLSSSSGQPGDPVLITGTGFSSAGGEIFFGVANGNNVAAPVTYWTNAQIIVTVPDAVVIQAFNGQVFVQQSGTSRRPVRSNGLPFRFAPAIEYKTLLYDGHSTRGAYSATIEAGTTENHNSLMIHDFADLLADAIGSYFIGPAVLYGGKGDEEFNGAPLKNGWTTDRAYLSVPGSSGGAHIQGSADAYISEFTVGTDQPHLKVHWWADALSAVWYAPYFVIKGPRGVPYK